MQAARPRISLRETARTVQAGVRGTRDWRVTIRRHAIQPPDLAMKPIARCMLAALTVVSATVQSQSAPASDVAAGQTRSVACQACHGGDGIGISGDVPNLAGQKPQYLQQQLGAFRSGDRKHDVMNPIAKQLSDADIQNLAAYWTSLPPSGNGHAAAEPAMLARRSHMDFPTGFPKGFTPYRTDEDAAAGSVSTFFANETATRAARAGEPLPAGSVFVVAMSRAKVDADKKPLKDAAGHLVAEAPGFYSAMEARADLGQGMPELLRNGDWTYALFDAKKQRQDQSNYAMCLGCHKSVASDSYVFTLKELKEKLKKS
jgi:cytochrome c553